MRKIFLLSIIAIVSLSGCNKDTDEAANNSSPTEQHNTNNSDLDHSNIPEIPNGLKTEAKPLYDVGSAVVISADYDKEMDGAKGEVVGAYLTTAYAVSYTPTTGGDRVGNHHWVIHEEIKNAGKESFKPGDEVKLEANHLKGMEGATAIIESAQKSVVYIVNYMPTTGGTEIINHKWLLEKELAFE